MKRAVITLLLKKVNLNPEDLKHFRPVSNLSFVSKLVEHVVASRLEQHISHEDLYESFRSSYWKGHSTETALLKIMGDLLQAMDRRECILVPLLDPSAAFDTVSNTISFFNDCMHASVSAALHLPGCHPIYRVVHKLSTLMDLPPQPMSLNLVYLKAQC